MPVEQEYEQASSCVNSAVNIKYVTEIFGCVYDIGWPNHVTQPKQNKTLQMYTVKNESGLGHIIFSSMSASPSSAKMDLSQDLSPSPDLSATNLP